MVCAPLAKRPRQFPPLMMYSVPVMGPVWGEVNKAASLAFTSNLQRNSDISRRKRQLCERFVRCEQKKLPTVSAFSCHAMRIALKPTFLVCRKTGTLPQIRQCHAGTWIYATVIRARHRNTINKFRNLRKPPRFGRRTALFPGERGDLTPEELRAPSNAC
jgi:hypothetical protein